MIYRLEEKCIIEEFHMNIIQLKVCTDLIKNYLVMNTVIEICVICRTASLQVYLPVWNQSWFCIRNLLHFFY